MTRPYVAHAVIRKVGNKYCVFSKNGKNLGCSPSREGAVKRLQQVEYFKNKGFKMTNFDEAIGNFTKALKEINPSTVGGQPESSPNRIDVPSETLNVSESLKEGTVAGFRSDLVIDRKDHFPVITQTQAQSSMTRVMQLERVPDWYCGSIAALRKEVYAGIMRLHPDIQFNVKVPADIAIALSDGETDSTTKVSDIKDPADVAQNQVKTVERPSLTSAEVQDALENEDARHAVAGRLMEMIDKQLEAMNQAKKLAQRLLKGGIKAEEFDQLSTYLQEDILRELTSRGVTASNKEVINRRRELLDRLNKND